MCKYEIAWVYHLEIVDKSVHIYGVRGDGHNSPFLSAHTWKGEGDTEYDYVRKNLQTCTSADSCPWFKSWDFQKARKPEL